MLFLSIERFFSHRVSSWFPLWYFWYVCLYLFQHSIWHTCSCIAFMNWWYRRIYTRWRTSWTVTREDSISSWHRRKRCNIVDGSTLASFWSRMLTYYCSLGHCVPTLLCSNVFIYYLRKVKRTGWSFTVRIENTKSCFTCGKCLWIIPFTIVASITELTDVTLFPCFYFLWCVGHDVIRFCVIITW